MSLFQELKRRNVIRVGAVYLVAVWLLLQVFDVVLSNLEVPAWVFQVILLVAALGFPVALIFAWAFELTPEGLKLEREVDRSSSITFQTGRKLDRIIIGCLVLVLAYMGYERLQQSDSSMPNTANVAAAPEQAVDESEQKSVFAATTIAVLPFINMSSDAEQEYFSDGLSEELLNLLAKIPELQVAARTSSFSLKERDLQIAEIGEILRVAHVLEGSVRKSGDRVRVTAQLIHAADGYHLWSETWDRTLNDVFAIQDEIAQAVVQQLKIELLGQTPTVVETDPQAYSLYFQAKAIWRQRSQDAGSSALTILEQALQIDPEYKDALVLQARIYRGLASAYVIPMQGGLSKARAALRQTLMLDPDFAPAHAVLAHIALGSDRLEEAAAHLQRALELAPSDPDVLATASSLAWNLGRMELALSLDRYALQLDPANPAAYSAIASNYVYAGHYDAAIEAYQTALALSPASRAGYYWLGLAQMFAGDFEAALASFPRDEDPEYALKGQVLALWELGRKDDFANKFEELKAGWGEQWPSEMAHVYAYTGQVELAFEWLDKALAQKEEGMAHQFTLPFYKNLYDDPRWALFRERTNTAQEFLDSIPLVVSVPQ